MWTLHALPMNVVEKYEHGVQTGIAVHQMVQCGPLFCTAYVERVQEDSAEVPLKKLGLKSGMHLKLLGKNFSLLWLCAFLFFASKKRKAWCTAVGEPENAMKC